MHIKLGKMVQKSTIPFARNLANPRLKCSLRRAKTATFALLKRARGARQKCKIANREIACRYRMDDWKFERRSMQNSLGLSGVGRAAPSSHFALLPVSS
jgi:hypothetical protein